VFPASLEVAVSAVAKQGTEPVGRLLLQYSLPAVAGFLANALYQLVDRAIVGNGVGTDAMAAVGCAFPLTMISFGAGLLLGTGTGNQISTFLGRGRREDAERVLGQSVVLALLVGGGFLVLYCAVPRPLLRLSGAEGAVLELAVPYLRVSAVGQVFLIALVAMGNILRVQGRPNLGLLFMVGGSVLNAGLCALAVFVLRLGVTGAALATTLSIGLNLAAVLVFVQGPRSALRIRRRHLRLDRRESATIVALGAPMFLMQVVGAALFFAMNHAAVLEGPAGVAAVSALGAVSQLLIFPPLGVHQAMQPLVAYNRGAGRFDRVRALLARVLWSTVAIGAGGALAVSLAAPWVAGLFTRSDQHLVALVREGLPWAMASVAFFPVQGAASNYFLAVHRPRAAGIVLLGRQLLALPLLVVLPAWFGFRGIFYVGVLADVPFAALAAALLRREWRALDREAVAAAAEPVRSSASG
jgi:putative MATE family efflux protein